jgi:ribosomal protein S3
MLRHLDAWVMAQKHWITLDPVYNSNLFANFFGENMTDFLECRSQYRRIMWSSYRN